MTRKLYVLGAIFGLTAVILGAFGAHGLKETLTPESLTSFETGVRYQMYHAFLAFVAGGLFNLSEGVKNTVFWLLLVGVLLFSGSIYLLSTKAATGIDISAVGFVTPLGGVVLIACWIFLLVRFLKK
ncbi:MAG: hypothetical protein CL868_06050 [Cytophagaceae bacterium]|nr:hypothetical protein [Cytophagaceae bacterium]|tara:strand:+ start:12307 stop:12687 length:381 start_codon:yes stop_codon:yes gene_type:complete